MDTMDTRGLNIKGINKFNKLNPVVSKGFDQLDVKLEVDKRAEFIINSLISNGYSAYLVGGSIRDALMNRELGTNRIINDWDIATSAKPDEVLKVFRALGLKVLNTGVQHGTVTVLLSQRKYDKLVAEKTKMISEDWYVKSEGFEITTYRVDGKYSDGRHPDEVKFTAKIEDDLTRRDLTINALAYANGKVVGVPGAFKDLQYGIIRAVGNPSDRMTEDPLRIIRAFRFQASLGFKIDEQTKLVMNTRLDTLDTLAKERIHTELVKAFSGEHILKAIRDNEELVFKLIPKLRVQKGYNQNNPNHDKELWEHTLSTLENVSNASYGDYILNIAALLHDIGKPDTVIDHLGDKYDSYLHYPQHGKVGASIAKEILKGLKFSNQEVSDITSLIEIHDRQIENKKALKRLIAKIGTKQVRRFFILRQGDIQAQSSYNQSDKLAKLSNQMAWFSEIQLEGEACTMSDLKISGNDLIDMGLKPGKQIGIILADCLDQVLSDNIENSRSKLIVYVEKKYNLK